MIARGMTTHHAIASSRTRHRKHKHWIYHLCVTCWHPTQCALHIWLIITNLSWFVCLIVCPGFVFTICLVHSPLDVALFTFRCFCWLVTVSSCPPNMVCRVQISATCWLKYTHANCIHWQVATNRLIGSFTQRVFGVWGDPINSGVSVICGSREPITQRCRDVIPLSFAYHLD